MRLARRLVIAIVAAMVIILLMQWILDVPEQYPDHGFAAFEGSMADLSRCLIDEIAADPAVFGVGSDFELRLEEGLDGDALEVAGWVRSSTVSSFDSATLIVESNTNPLADPERIPTLCGSF